MPSHTRSFFILSVSLVVILLIIMQEHARMGAEISALNNQTLGTALVATNLYGRDTLQKELRATSDGALMPSPLFTRATSATPPSLTAHAALVADLKSNAVYFESNGGMRWPAASLSKLMSAWVVTHTINETSIVPFVALGEAAGDQAAESARGKLQYSAHDLLRMMLMASNNDAAEALATFYGRTDFIGAMNRNASRWGMVNTFFEDPSGISSANQSTVEDLEKLVVHIWSADRGIFDITTIPSITIKERTALRNETVTSTNIFAGEPIFLGGKTGYTPEANGNLISLFSYKQAPILVIVLGSDDRFGETRALWQWFEENYQ